MSEIKQAICRKLVDWCKILVIPIIATKCIDKYEIFNVGTKNGFT